MIDEPKEYCSHCIENEKLCEVHWSPDLNHAYCECCGIIPSSFVVEGNTIVLALKLVHPDTLFKSLRDSIANRLHELEGYESAEKGHLLLMDFLIRQMKENLAWMTK